MSLKTLLRRFAPLFYFAAFVILACTVVGNDPGTQTFSFNKSFDTLTQFDSVTITLRDTNGLTIDVLYRGKADSVREIENLPAAHWNGGIAVLSIIGYDSGVVVYHVDKKFNGRNDQILDTTRVILPGTFISADALELTMVEGDSIPFPKIIVVPLELSDKTVVFTSSSPNLLQAGTGYLRALKRGTVKLTATLKSNPIKSIAFNVTISANPLIPDKLDLSPDSLRIAAGGAPGTFTVSVIPLSAESAVIWGLADSSIAQFTAPGILVGLKPGSTLVRVSSVRNPALKDSGLVLVTPPVAVTQVQFDRDSLDLFVGGAKEILSAKVVPAQANRAVDFIAVDPSILSLLGNQAQGLKEGATLVIARSRENPLAADTLKVMVFPSQKIDSVKVTPDSLRLYTGGEAGILTGKVYPLASGQSISWRLQDPSLASWDALGRVQGLAPGKTVIVALSRVDSTKKDTVRLLVKRDVPQVNVGMDTVVSLGSTLYFRPRVTQEYGSIVLFKWDLNGDGIFEGTSDSLKTVSQAYLEAKDVVAAFSVKDSEGNDTTVFKKIKAVAGPAVQILSPLDSSYTRLFSIAVTWSVNGKIQDSLNTQILKVGANTITRSAKDAAGNSFPSSITVIVDTLPPGKPIVRGPVVSGSKTPTWTWATGGGGIGMFKYWLDVDDSSKGKEIKDTSYTPATELPEGIHTLFVSESDKAGNWSLAGRFSIKIDQSAPSAPVVKTIPSSPTNLRKPKWSWTPVGTGGIGAFQYKLDNNNLATGATPTTDTVYTPANPLSGGLHTLYVQEQDSAGNWSESGFAAIVIDTVAPGAPTVTSTSISPTNESRPIWNWTGGGGGKGFYRYKVGDTVWASGGRQGSVLTYRPETALAEGARTLFVSEQDSAGNWSAAGSFGVTLDLTAPAAPKMDSTPNSPLNSLRPTWTWKPGGGGNGTYRCKVDNADLSVGASTVGAASFSQPTDLPEGKHTLYVQERDAAGNWSSGSIKVAVLALRKTVGAAGFAEIGYSTIGSAISKTGEVYISSVDNLDSNKSLVMKFNGTTWVKLGTSGLGVRAFGRCPIAVSETGVPYVVYNEPYVDGSLDNYKASVIRWNGTSWLPVGNAAFSEGQISYPAIAISSNGTPYVAFKDDAQGPKLSVMYLIGARWEYVGSPGISDGSLDQINIAVSGSGTPYVVFVDQSGPTKNTIMKYSGSSWTKLGEGTSSGGVGSVAINKAGVPYFAFRSNDDGSKASVFRWTGTALEAVGNPGFSDADVGQISIKFSSNDVPYVGFDDYYTPNPGGSSSKPTVMRLEGSKWVTVGPARISEGVASSTTLVLDQNDVPYAVFNDEFLGRKATVMKASFDP
jgi:hypothetical protein